MSSVYERLQAIQVAQLCAKCEKFQGCLFLSALLATEQLREKEQNMAVIMQNPGFNKECTVVAKITEVIKASQSG